MGPGSQARGGRLVAIAVAVALAPRGAHADAAAEQLFRDGRQLLVDGKIAEACERFQRSHDLEPKVGTLLNLADCRERQGQLANAWADFLEAKALAARQNDPRAAEAARRAAAIEPRLAHLTIQCAPDHHIDGFAVTRNGVAVPPAVWDTAVPVEPGEYVVEAKAPGHKPWSAKVTVAAGKRGSAAVPALVADPSKPAIVTAPPTAPGPGVVAPAAGVAAAVAPQDLVPPLGRIGVGLQFGGSSPGSDIIFGARVLGSVRAPLGAIRPVAHVAYTSKYGDTLVAGGFALDYLVAWGRGAIATAGGLGVGFDYQTGAGYSDKRTWASLRISPVIVRVAKPRLEIGLHGQRVLVPGDYDVWLGFVALDWFVW